MKKCFLVLVFALLVSPVFSQTMSKGNDYGINALKFEVRGDFDCLNQHDSTWSGFTGKYLNFIMKGDLNESFYYAYRQRLNKINSISNFFNATDYLYLGWRITKNISWTAGK